MVERSADWMAQGVRDLEHARHDLDTAYYEWACFSSQQAAGKAVKSVFQKLGADVRGYSVADLLKELTVALPVSDALLEDAHELDDVYLSARYPDALPEGSPGDWFTRREGVRLVENTERIVEFCQGLLATL